MFLRFKKLFILIFLITACFFVVDFSFAQSSVDWGNEYPRNLGLEGENEDVRDVIVRIVNIIFTFLGIIAVFFIMWSGWMWMTSEGDASKVDKAKKTLINTVIGIIIILCSFLIVTWIMNNFPFESSNNIVPNNREPKPHVPNGISTVGDCIVGEVYPAPNQKDVPRNTSIIVSFKEEIDAKTICNSNVCNGENIIAENIRIYKKEEGDACVWDTDSKTWIDCSSKNVTLAKVYSTDNKTFVFVLNEYLGSSADYVWYSVYLSPEISKINGNSAFDTCRTDFFEWSFEVSTKIDLTPPQVIEGDIFPDPDNAKDTKNSESAISAKGSIVISSVLFGSRASFNNVEAHGDSPQADVNIYGNCNQTGSFEVVINSEDEKKAQIKNGAILLGAADVNGLEIDFPGYIKMTLASKASSGNSWTIYNVKPAKDADKLKIGNISYVFIDDAEDAASNEVVIGANNKETSDNLIALINASHPQVAASFDNNSNSIKIESKIAGESGNDIILEENTSAERIQLSGDFLTGGVGNDNSYEKQGGSWDEPINTIIQINFNEAILPITVSGNSVELENFIRVRNLTDGSILTGKFVVSNLFQTVEFIPDNACGLNACGEEIYCLPKDANLVVELNAANLETCMACESKTPFNKCENGHCFNESNSIFYPLSKKPFDGIMDIAMNSLDGNRTAGAEGPVFYYNENEKDVSSGDSFKWSFFTNNVLDIGAPIIQSIEPSINQSNVDLESPVVLIFDKVMMKSSLKTGQVNINNGKENITHQLLNLWSLGADVFGYWIFSENIDENPADGEPENTQVEIRHTKFGDNFSQRAQVGSGVKDIRQNCYRPSSGPADGGDCIGGPSCCDGNPINSNDCLNSSN